MTTNFLRIARLMAAHEAMVPYWKDGSFQEAPAALASEYADALVGAPASYWQDVERLVPGTGSALLAWAQDHTERRDYPEFFAMLAEIGRIRDEQGEEAAAAPVHAELLMKMMHVAPPRYLVEAEAVTADAVPEATHVDDHGQPVYSAQQIADTLGVPVEAIEAGILYMEDVGLLDGLHTGPVHLLQ